MSKSEYREHNEITNKYYDKSILSHEDDENDSMKDYEFSILHKDDEYDSLEDYESCSIGHFKD